MFCILIVKNNFLLEKELMRNTKVTQPREFKREQQYKKPSIKK